MSANFHAYTNSAKASELCELQRNVCTTAGGLAIKAASNADAKTVNAILYSIAGKFYSLAAQATLDLSALCAGTIAAGASAGVFLFVNAAGTVTASLVHPNSAGEIVCPDTVTKVCFGSIKIANGTGTAFTVGTTLLDAANVTTTYSDHSLIMPGQAI